jgi:hypothetical protein
MPGGTGKYLRVLNSIAWMERSRPDIACAVSYLQTQQAAPRIVDWTDVQHLLGYLRGTSNLGVLFNRTSIKPCLYVDVGWAVHPRDRKSHTGHMLLLSPEGPLIEWGSSKQKSVASSSMDAELIGLSDRADALLVVNSKLKFLGVKVPLPMNIYQDNTSTITVSYMGRPSASARRRYIDIRYFWLKQYLDNNTFRLLYCPSAVQFADILASVRTGQQFVAFVQRFLAIGPARKPKNIL